MTTLTLLSVQRVHACIDLVTFSHNGLYIAYTYEDSNESYEDIDDTYQDIINTSGPEVVINIARRRVISEDISTVPAVDGSNDIRCRPRWRPHGLKEIAEIQWSPNDNIIIIYDGDYCAYVHDSKTGEQIGEYIRGVSHSHFLSWNKKGDAVCYVGYDDSTQNCVIIRKLLTGEDIIIKCGDPSDLYISAAWSPDGTSICTIHRYGKDFTKNQIKYWAVS